MNTNSNSISVLLGNGTKTNTFQAQKVRAVGDHPIDLVVADFNRDGILDVATANQFAASVSVLLGNGDGTLQAPITIGVGSGPLGIDAGDLDGDGFPDLAVVNNGANTVSIVLNKGDRTGAFYNSSPVGAAGDTYSVLIRDFDRDGKQDLAVTSYSGGNPGVVLYPGKGDGSFKVPTRYPVAGNAFRIASADFNTDGILDVVTSDDGGTINTLNGMSPSGFKPRVSYTGGFRALFLTTGDLNGDGVLDIVFADRNGSDAGIMFGNGDINATFADPVFRTTGTNSQPWGVVVADFNLDGRPDIATANAGTDNVTVLISAGKQPTITLQPLSQNPACNSTLNFSINATVPAGTGTATFQWRKNGTAIPGATAKTLAYGPVTLNDNGTLIDCVVTNNCGHSPSVQAKITICRTDFNCDGFVTGDDFDLYVGAFTAGDLAADLNQDGFVTGDDYDAYVEGFVAGC